MEQLEPYEEKWNWRLEGGEEESVVSARVATEGHGCVCGYAVAAVTVNAHGSYHH